MTRVQKTCCAHAWWRVTARIVFSAFGKDAEYTRHIDLSNARTTANHSQTCVISG